MYGCASRSPTTASATMASVCGLTSRWTLSCTKHCARLEDVPEPPTAFSPQLRRPPSSVFQAYLEDAEACEAPDTILLQLFDRVAAAMARVGLCLRHGGGNFAGLAVRLNLQQGGDGGSEVLWFGLEQAAGAAYREVVQVRFPFHDGLAAILATYFEQNLPGATWLSSVTGAGAGAAALDDALFDPQKDAVLLESLRATAGAMAEKLTADWDSLRLLAAGEQRDTDGTRSGPLLLQVQRWLWLLEEWRLASRLCTARPLQAGGDALQAPCALRCTQAQWRLLSAALSAQLGSPCPADEEPAVPAAVHVVVVVE